MDTKRECRPNCSVEVRRVAVETISYQSKKTGRKESFTKLTVGAEILGSGEAVTLSMPLPDGATKENTKVPFKKGDFLAVVLDDLTHRAGVYSGRFSEYETADSLRGKGAVS